MIVFFVSQSMEAAGVLTLYKRTPEGIRYSPFVGDGDSKSYSQLEQAAPYGPSFHIPKEDCIAHVTKRMGTNLRKKWQNTKVGKLVQKYCTQQLQHYYSVNMPKCSLQYTALRNLTQNLI